jgi:hypothetical protein
MPIEPLEIQIGRKTSITLRAQGFAARQDRKQMEAGLEDKIKNNSAFSGINAIWKPIEKGFESKYMHP